MKRGRPKLSKAHETVTLKFKLPQWLADDLAEACYDNDITKSEYIRSMIIERLYRGDVKNVG